MVVNIDHDAIRAAKNTPIELFKEFEELKTRLTSLIEHTLHFRYLKPNEKRPS